MKFIIKPFSEIMIKSKPVRKRFMQFLATNIKNRLDFELDDFKVQTFWDKLEVNIKQSLDEKKKKDIINALSRLPWIEFFLEVIEYEIEGNSKKEQFDFIFKKAKEYFLDKIEWKSFVVRAKRAWEHKFSSIDIERYVWGWLLKFSNNSKVDLKNPEYKVALEIKDNKLYIITNKLEGIWGYPVWTQDKVISLISWWFDSGVSTFSLMKRGARVDYLFFNLWGTAHELGVKQVAYYLWKNFSAWYKARFITIDFQDIVKELLTKINHKYRWILLKRLFLKVADNLAWKYEYYGIVKWDSLGQVSSQTLKNMFVIDKACSTLVLRPLIGFNKQEIVDLSKKIGTYDFACNMPEYCWVISDKPATGAKLEDVEKQEEKLDFSLLDKAIKTRKVQKIVEVLEDKIAWEDIEVCYIPWEEEVVIDIREEENIAKKPLVLENTEILKIPFYEINSKFKDLAQDKTYLFYCDKWVLSRLHALYLKEQGFDNIKIYRYLEKGCELK